jgi:hypothetical protein
MPCSRLTAEFAKEASVPSRPVSASSETGMFFQPTDTGPQPNGAEKRAEPSDAVNLPLVPGRRGWLGVCFLRRKRFKEREAVATGASYFGCERRRIKAIAPSRVIASRCTASATWPWERGRDRQSSPP